MSSATGASSSVSSLESGLSETGFLYRCVLLGYFMPFRNGFGDLANVATSYYWDMAFTHKARACFGDTKSKP